MPQNHLIHQVKLDLNIQENDNSLEHANHVVDEYKKAVLDTINEFFEGLHIDSYLLIENLNIHIDNVHSLEQLKGKLEQQLCSFFDVYVVNNHWFIANSDLGKKTDALEILSYPTLDDLMFFLAKGEFRWEYHKQLFRHEEDVNSFESILKEYLVKISIDEFFQLALNFPFIIFRTIYYFPTLKDLVYALLIPTWYVSKTTVNVFIKDKLEIQLNEISRSGDQNRVKPFLEILYLAHLYKEEPLLLLILLLVVDGMEEVSDMGALKSAIKLDLLLATLSLKHIQYIIDEIYAKTSIQFNEGDIRDILNILRNESKSELVIESKKESLITDILSSDDDIVRNIKYCGIIFLHPYLNQLFDTFNLLENKIFKSVEAQVKAVYLLFYLTTLQTEAAEDDFEFLKLVVGLDSTTFIVPHFELNVDETKQCREILEALIREWSVLKSTSIETIQHNFLQRRGVVREEERTIDIYLEKSAFDVLLDHFPYNYSLVKLKWLDKLICVVL